MAKLKLAQCPECNKEVYGRVVTVPANGYWQVVWQCPECNATIIIESEETNEESTKSIQA